MRLLSTPSIGRETGVVGRGGVADPHGHNGCSGVNSSRLREKTVEGNYVRLRPFVRFRTIWTKR